MRGAGEEAGHLLGSRGGSSLLLDAGGSYVARAAVSLSPRGLVRPRSAAPAGQRQAKEGGGASLPAGELFTPWAWAMVQGGSPRAARASIDGAAGSDAPSPAALRQQPDPGFHGRQQSARPQSARVAATTATAAAATRQSRSGSRRPASAQPSFRPYASAAAVPGEAPPASLPRRRRRAYRSISMPFVAGEGLGPNSAAESPSSPQRLRGSQIAQWSGRRPDVELEQLAAAAAVASAVQAGGMVRPAARTQRPFSARAATAAGAGTGRVVLYI